MLNLVKLPKIKTGEHFEALCQDVLQVKYNVIPKKFGRSGQVQNGIDLLLTILTATENVIIGVQCKNLSENTKNRNVLLKEIKENFNKAKGGQVFSITHFLVMTTWSRDNYIQSYIGALQQQSSIPIDIMFWDDIENILLENPKLIQNYYPMLYESNYCNYLTLLNLAFIGTQFADLIFEMLGDRGETTKYCDMLEAGKDWLQNYSTKEKFLQYLTQVRRFVNGPISFEMIANPSRKYDQYYWCEQIETIVNALVDNLTTDSRPYFIIGNMLGQCCKPNQGVRNKGVYQLSPGWKTDFISQCAKLHFTVEEIQKISSLCDNMYLDENEDELPTKKIGAPFEIYEYIRKRLLLR